MVHELGIVLVEFQLGDGGRHIGAGLVDTGSYQEVGLVDGAAPILALIVDVEGGTGSLFWGEFECLLIVMLE